MRYFGIFFMTDKFSIRITKYYFNDWCLMNLLSTLLFLPYFQLNKLLPHNDKDVNQVTLNHITL